MRKIDRDHERYMRDRENRLAHQAEYYKVNRDAILNRKRNTGNMKYGSLRKR